MSDGEEEGTTVIGGSQEEEGEVVSIGTVKEGELDLNGNLVSSKITCRETKMRFVVGSRQR